MRGVIIPVLVFVFGTVVTVVLERVVKDAPEWIWRLMYGGAVVGPVAIALLSDPFYQYLAGLRKHPFTSTLIIAVAGGIVLAAIWLFWIVGFPSSKSYSASRALATAATSSLPPPAPHSPGPGLRIADHAEVAIERSIFPDTTQIEATDHSKARLSDDFFYQTRSPSLRPQVPNFIGKIWIVETSTIETEEKPQSLSIFALLEIKNSGSPSVVDEFHATLKVGKDAWEIQRSARLEPNLTILRQDDTQIKLDESDMMYSRLASGNPIVEGGRLAGCYLLSKGHRSIRKTSS
jgi:hypothetical protein